VEIKLFNIYHLKSPDGEELLVRADGVRNFQEWFYVIAALQAIRCLQFALEGGIL